MICKTKRLGEKVDSSDIKKHKKMFCVLLRSLCLKKVEELPTAVDADIHSFIDLLEREPFDQNSLKRYGLKMRIYGIVKESIRIKVLFICHGRTMEYQTE